MREDGERRTRALRRGVVAVLRSAGDHRVAPMAGEAAFFAALAVFPTLLTVVGVVRTASTVIGPGAGERAAQGLTELLRVVLTTRGSAAADAAADLLADDTGGAFTVGTLAALVLLSRALRSVLHAIGVISGNPRSRLLPAAVGLAAVTLVGAALVIGSAVQDPLGALGVPRAEGVWSVMRWPLVGAALLGWAAILLRVGMGSAMEAGGRRGLLIGALFTTLGWAAASLLFPLYVDVATRFTNSLGALGGGLILLVWLYLLMLVLYAGAEIRVAWDRHEPGPSHAARRQHRKRDRQGIVR